ncbi:MAG TPA: hypothetical protein VLX08_04785 [Steroidobacteraceae bacterium]|nr:hypothetical protein [Steroidobacteraceae bacterium]
MSFHAGESSGAADALGSIVMRACYCSVFDECWLSDLRTLHPPRLKECPVPGVPFRG